MRIPFSQASLSGGGLQISNFKFQIEEHRLDPVCARNAVDLGFQFEI
jgi:hypothetical protein